MQILEATLISRNDQAEAVRRLGERGVGAAASYVVSRWTQGDRAAVKKELETEKQWMNCVEGKGTSNNNYCQVLKLFKVEDTVRLIMSHRKAVQKIWKRFRKQLPNLDAQTVKVHDVSKTDSLEELLGLTDRYVWGFDSPLYREALRLHISTNPHHPQFYRRTKHVSWGVSASKMS